MVHEDGETYYYRATVKCDVQNEDEMSTGAELTGPDRRFDEV